MSSSFNFLPLLLLLCAAHALEDGGSSVDIELHDGWRLRGPRGIDVPANVPGTVQTDLLAAGLIPEPYEGYNERDIQWISKEEWEYVRNISLPGRGHARLVFEGLNTFARLSLDGTLLGETDNAHHPFVFDLPPSPGPHELSVRFRPPEAVTAPLAAAAARPLPCDQYAPPASELQERGPAYNRSYARKPGVDYGWNWAPALLPAGIYRPARLQVRPRYVVVRGQSVADDGSALVLLRCFLHSPAPARGVLTASLAGVSASRAVAVPAGDSYVPLSIAVPPAAFALWWPNGLGEQPLYELRATFAADGRPPASLAVHFGFRTLEWVQEKEGAGGASFFVRLNGRPLFLQGAAWVPPDAFEPRAGRERVRALLASAAAAGMNAVRVWGGGTYPPSWFYDAADELGLLVWQDFAFACCLHPADGPFLERVRREVEHQVRRLASHPSLALWCGSNENELALAEWYRSAARDPQPYRADFERLTYGVIGAAVAREDPGRLFWPSSPSSGPGASEAPNWEGQGDVHYWPRWSALPQEPVDGVQDWGNPYGAFLAGYRRLRPRFASEFGALAFPSPAALRPYAPAGQLHPLSAFVRWRTRSPYGHVETLGKLGQWFGEAGGDDYGRFAFLSQALQGLTLRNAIEHFRRLAPRTMGALYWQLNDLWPGPSESTLEHGGAWRLSHYAARAAFAPLAPSFLEAPNGTLQARPQPPPREPHPPRSSGSPTAALRRPAARCFSSSGPGPAPSRCTAACRARLSAHPGAGQAGAVRAAFAVGGGASAMALELDVDALLAAAHGPPAHQPGDDLLAAQWRRAGGVRGGVRVELAGGRGGEGGPWTRAACFVALYVQREGQAEVDWGRPAAWHPLAPPAFWRLPAARPVLKVEAAPVPEGEVAGRAAELVCRAGGGGSPQPPAARQGLRVVASRPAAHVALEGPVPGWFTAGDFLALPGRPTPLAFCPWRPTLLDPAAVVARFVWAPASAPHGDAL